MFQNLFIKTQNVKPLGLAVRPLFTLLVLVKPGGWLTQRAAGSVLKHLLLFPRNESSLQFHNIILMDVWLFLYSSETVAVSVLCFQTSFVFLSARGEGNQISGSTGACVWINTDYLSALCKYVKDVSWAGNTILMGGGEDNICLSYLVLAKAFCCSWTLSWI